MRGLHTRKRSRPSSGPFRTKRRRVMKRRRITRKSTNWTSQSSKGGGLGFSNKRTSRRQFKRILWNSTVPQNHFRSNGASTTNILTPAGAGTASTMTVTVIASRRPASTNFYVAAGGAINPDGGAIPTFLTNADITVRGGIYGLRLCNAPDLTDTDKDPVSCIVYAIRTTKNWNSTNVPTSVNVGWDPTLTQDFQTNIGKVIFRKNFLINDGEVINIERRMAIQKIDQTEYVNSISEIVWFILSGNTSSITSKVVLGTTYHNLSFVADAV